jgi:hypothetical protein
MDEAKAKARTKLGWIALVIVLAVSLIGLKFDQVQQAADRQARPDYYAHIDQFGEPINFRDAVDLLESLGYEDIDFSHIKGPLIIPEGWLLGMVFKSKQNPNDELHWFVKSGKRGLQDLKMYPGGQYPYPVYP